jgi:hypothetical protein
MLHKLIEKLLGTRKGRQMPAVSDEDELFVGRPYLVKVLLRLRSWRDRIGVTLKDEKRQVELHPQLAGVERHEFVIQLLE